MGCGAATVVRICYEEGNEKRFVKGKLIGEDENFIEIELNNYITRIAKRQIIKIEAMKPRRESFDY